MSGEAAQPPLSQQVLSMLHGIIVDCDELSRCMKAVQAGLPQDDPLWSHFTSLKLRVAWLRSNAYKGTTDASLVKSPEWGKPEREPEEAHTYHQHGRRPRLSGAMAAANDRSLQEE